MALTVILVCGPGQAGKSLLVRMLARRTGRGQCWHLRLLPHEAAPDVGFDHAATGLFAGAHCVRYSADGVFEMLPEVVRNISRQQADATVLIEADANPALRYAFPYDYRLFVLAAPRNHHEVFRTPAQAAAAMKQMMEDTASFAAEMFGLFDHQAMAGDPQITELRCPAWHPQAVVEIDPQQLQDFLSSPLGAEIASQVQLQPAYHGLMDSDVVVVNLGARPPADATQECCTRIEELLARLHAHENRPQLYCCDPTDSQDPCSAELVRHLTRLTREDRF